MRKRQIIGSSFVAVLFVALIWLMATIPQIPFRHKLADCTRRQFGFAFTCPRGTRFQLLLGTPPRRERQPYEGRIRITEAGRPVYEFPFSAASASGSNWLEGHGLTGDILTWAAKDGLTRTILPGRRYDVLVSFRREPPEGSSLWLSGLKRSGGGDLIWSRCDAP